MEGGRERKMEKGEREGESVREGEMDRDRESKRVGRIEGRETDEN